MAKKLMGGDPVALEQPVEQSAIETARSAVIDVLRAAWWLSRA